MSINKKLTGSLLIIIFFISLSFLLYYVMTKPIQKMTGEKEVLTLLQASINKELIVLGQFSYAKLDDISSEYKNISKKNSDNFESLTTIDILVKKSRKIEESIELIIDIKRLIEIKRVKLFDSMELVQKSSQGLSSTSNIIIMGSVIRSSSNSSSQIKAFEANIYKLIGDAESMFNVLTKSQSIIDEQYSVIESEIKKIQWRSQTLSIVLGVLMTLTGMILSHITTKRVSTGIKHIDAKTEFLRDGDLSNRYEITANDELGKLSSSLNIFLDLLSHSIKSFQSTSNDNLTVRDKMVSSCRQTLQSIRQINSYIEEFSGFSLVLNESVNISEGAITEILSSINTVQEMIEQEVAMVVESSASINQIISTVYVTSEKVDQNRLTVERLVKLSEIGEEKLSNTNGSIKDITDSISQIKGMADLIEDISQRTNLLSMNAAIEAAHAGEAGKGFAVVADEIRKLAEASTENSKTIADNIQNVVDIIHRADGSSQETAESFREIRKDIELVNSNTTDTLHSMNELASAGTEVQKAMLQLQDLTADLNTTSTDMTQSTIRVKESVNRLKDITSTVISSSRDISLEINSIHTEIQEVTEAGDIMSDISQNLDSELKKFRT